MKREVILWPAATRGYSLGDIDPNGSPYGGSPQMSLDEAWRTEDTHPTVQPNGSYWYYWPSRLTGGSADALVSFDPPPTLAIFTKVTLEVEWDYAQSGPAILPQLRF